MVHVAQTTMFSALTPFRLGGAPAAGPDNRQVQLAVEVACRMAGPTPPRRWRPRRRRRIPPRDPTTAWLMVSLIPESTLMTVRIGRLIRAKRDYKRSICPEPTPLLGGEDAGWRRHQLPPRAGRCLSRTHSTNTVRPHRRPASLLATRCKVRSRAQACDWIRLPSPVRKLTAEGIVGEA